MRENSSGLFAHAPQVGRREAARPRKFRLQVARQIGDHRLSPALALLPGDDQAPDIGVEVQQLAVHLPQGRDLGRADPLFDLAQQ